MTGKGHSAPAQLQPEIAAVARGSAVNLAAMTLGAALGFGLTVLVSRWLQPAGAGVVFELIAIFTILSNTFELGADTGLTRWISRARAIGGLADIRPIVVIALLPVLVVGAAAASAVWIAAPEIARTFLHGATATTGATDIRIIAPLIPLGALSTCILAGARGFHRMWPYLAIQGLGQPALRLALVLVALAVGWGVRGAIVGWSLPVAIGLLASWVIFARLIRAEAPATGWLRASPIQGSLPTRSARAARRLPARRKATGRRALPLLRTRAPIGGRHRKPSRQGPGRLPRLAAEFWRFTAPRGFAATFQIIVLWLDVLLVGALVGDYAAGVYGAVSKLAVVGTFALEGNRLAIGPQLSALLARHEFSRAASLYQSATRWLMLASWPLYITFAVFPAVVLGIFGHRYTAGTAALVVLSLAMLVNLGTGNVTVVLLMGGKSSWSAINAAAALIVNVGLNLILLPHLGIVGAAIAWAASIVLDNVLAVAEVWWVLGMGAFGPGYGLVVFATVASFGLTDLVAREVLGQSLPALAGATVAGLAIFAVILYRSWQRLELAGLSAALRVRLVRPAARQSDQQAA